MQQLSSYQLVLAGEFIQESLQKVIDSLERMLNVPLKAKEIKFGNGSLDELDELETLGRFRVQVVKMEFSGKIGGALYFIIKAFEVDEINKIGLPENIVNENTSGSRMMRKGFMEEIKNIIASLSIGEISEFLGVELIGKVPEVNKMRAESVNDYLQEQNEINRTAFYMKAKLGGKYGLMVAPLFIWMLDEKFVETLKLNS